MYNTANQLGDRPTQLYWQSVYRSISSFIPLAIVPGTVIVAFSPDGKIALIRRQDTQLGRY